MSNIAIERGSVPPGTGREPTIPPDDPVPKPPDDEPPSTPGEPVTEPPVDRVTPPLRA